MKKLTAILLSVMMVIGCFSIMAVSAAETATINVAGNNYTVDVGKSYTYTVNLKTEHPIINFEFYLNYPQSLLTVTDYDFPVVGKGNVCCNYTDNVVDEFRLNYSQQSNPIDFTSGNVFLTVNFKVNAAGTGKIGFINEEEAAPGQLKRESVLSWVDENYIIRDELETAKLTETLTVNDEPSTGDTQDTGSTEATQATQDTGSTEATQATEAPKTKISVKAAKSRIYVGDTTTVTAKVTNKVGKTTFTSSNKNVATVSSTGKVKGIKSGTVTITAKNNKAKASVRITVVKKSNPMTVKTKTVSAKAKKTTTISKSKAFTIKKAQGTVTFKKSSGDKKITINKKSGKITVKKGLKKGKTYKLKVKVTAAGNTKYKATTKTVTVKIKVK